MTDEIMELRERLRRAEQMLQALEGNQVDAVVGSNRVALLRLREVEEELKRSEARFRAIVEDQTDLICRWNCDGLLTFVNEEVIDVGYFPASEAALDQAKQNWCDATGLCQ